MKKLLLISIVSISNFANAQWTQQNAGIPNNLNDVYFINADTGYVAATIGSTTKIIKTVDGGSTWTNVQSNAYAILSICFYNELIGFASGAGSQILTTTDGGQTWGGTGVNCCSNSYNSIIAKSATDIVAVGGNGASGGIIVRSTTGGLNWTGATVPSAGVTDLNCVHFPSLSIGYVVGNAGTILKSTDGGSNWTYLSPNLITQYRSVFFTNDSTGYIVGNAGTIFKTINGGSTWTPQVSGFPTSILYDVYFVNENIGYISGSNGLLLKTIDGGTNWTSEISATTFDLHSVHFPNICTGYAVGDASVIIKNACITTSVNKDNLNSFEIYPNPSKDQTTIVFTEEQKNTTVRITDMLGKEIKTINFNGTKMTIEKEELKEGIYFIQTTDMNKEYYSHKLIIQ